MFLTFHLLFCCFYLCVLIFSIPGLISYSPQMSVSFCLFSSCPISPFSALPHLITPFLYQIYHLFSPLFFLNRHPWTFIVTKGDASSAVEDHAVYQGRNQFSNFCYQPDLTYVVKKHVVSDLFVCLVRDQGLLRGPELSCFPVELWGAFHHHHQQPVDAR